MKIYKSEFKDVDIRKAKSKILKEATFSVTNVDSAIDTISDCIQWIMVKKSLNPSISAELISKAIVQGFDTLSSATDAPEEAVQQRAKLTAKKLMRNIVGFISGKKTSEDF